MKLPSKKNKIFWLKENCEHEWRLLGMDNFLFRRYGFYCIHCLKVKILNEKYEEEK